MNILVFCFEYPPIGGGGGVGAQQYAEAWAAAGHRVAVVTSRARGLARLDMVNGVEVRRVATLGRRDRATSTFFSMLCYNVTGALHVLTNRRALAGYDVINTHFSIPTGPLAAFASRVLRRPNVLTIIGGDIFDPTKRSSPHRSPLLRRVNRRLIDGADRVIAISGDTKQRAEEHYGITRPIRVINYGFKPLPPPDATRPPRRDDGTFRLISVGRLVSRKGFEHLIQATARLPDHVRLTIIGDGPLETPLRRLAAEVGLADRIDMPGFMTRAEIADRLRDADCYVLSSLHEGLGIVVQEAMDAGLPVVATNNGGQVDLIAEGRNGLLVDPTDVDALTAAIRSLIDDPDLAASMGACNATDIRNLYVEQNCELYIDEFRETASVAATPGVEERHDEKRPVSAGP